MGRLSFATIKLGTTPVIEMSVADVSIQDATLYITFDQGDRRLVKSNYHNAGDITAVPVYNDQEEQIATDIAVQLSQEDTLQLRPGVAKVEVGWVFDDGIADKTDFGRVEINDTLYKGVMAYGKD